MKNFCRLRFHATKPTPAINQIMINDSYFDIEMILILSSGNRNYLYLCCSFV